MFWTEEDIQPAVTAAESTFGRQAQYHSSPFVDIIIETPKFGTIWYGDVSGTVSDVAERAQSLSSKLNDIITVRDAGTLSVIFASNK